MEIKVFDNSLRTVFIEKVTKGTGTNVMSSEIRPPTKEEINKFKHNSCRHDDFNIEQLVYDVKGFYWDERFCAVCGCSLGLV